MWGQVRSNKEWKLRCFRDGWLGPDVGEPVLFCDILVSVLNRKTFFYV